jgi:hypothetical protein
MKNATLAIISTFIVLISMAGIHAESPFSDRINTPVENCGGCSFDGRCLPVGTLINPGHYCSESGLWVTKSFFNLSNGRNAEIKIMPETASQIAIEKLGELNFTIQLKEVGKKDNARPVYELTGKKQGKFLGIFKIMAKVEVQVDAEDGNVKVIKPWWAFLASGI